MLELILLDGSDRRVALTEGTELTVGTAAGCALHMTAPDVSRAHALLTCQHGRAIVLDLGSTNGTFLNGRRVKEAEITAGDLLRFSSIMVQVAPAGGEPTGDEPGPAEGEAGGGVGNGRGSHDPGSRSPTSDQMPALFADTFSALFARWGAARQAAQADLVAWLVESRGARGAAVIEAFGREIAVVAAHGEVRAVLEDPACAALVRGGRGDDSPQGIHLTLAGERVLALSASGLPWLLLVAGPATPDVGELSALARLLAVARRLDGTPPGPGRR